MINYSRFITTILLLIFSATSMAQVVSIKGRILKSPDPNLVINTPVNGCYFEGANLLFKIDSISGEFQIDIQLTQAGFMTLANNWRKTLIYVRPGGNYCIEWDMQSPNEVVIRGDESEGQALLQRLELGGNGKKQSALIDKLATVEDRIAFADSVATRKAEAMLALFQKGIVKQDFYESTLALIEADRINGLSTNFFFEYRKWEKPTESGASNYSLFFDNYLPKWGTLYIDPISFSKLLLSPAYTDILGRYYSYLNLRDSKKLIFGRGNYAMQYINEFKSKLKGRYLEHAWANMIVVGIRLQKFEIEWLDNYADFKSEFPHSDFIPLLEPIVAEVANYHNRIVQNKSEGIHFIKNYESIDSLDELLKNLNSKVTYVDLWATWCQPCRQELKYSIEMHDELEALGVDVLYISLDKENADKLWNSMVFGLGLKGLSMRANAKLNADLKKRIPNFHGIPRYLIVDKTGKVVQWNAKRPSDKSDLINELKKYL